MAKAQTKKKRKSKETAQRWWRRPVLIALRILPWVIVTAGLASGLWMGAETAWQAITGHARFSVSPGNVSFEMPEYVEKNNMERLFRQELKGVLDGAHMFDRHLPDRVEQTLLEQPWVTAVMEIRRLLPNKLKCIIESREPAGRVRIGRDLHMVDREGYRLPGELYRAPRTWTSDPPPVIVHEDISRLPPRGRRWKDAGLPVGARFSQFIQGSGIMESLAIQEILVTHVGAEMRGADIADVSLRTEAGAVIGWGTTDAYHAIDGLNRRVGEPSDSRKMDALRGFLNDYPDLRGIEYLDMRFNRMTYVMSDT